MQRIILIVEDNALCVEPLEVALLQRADLEVRVVSTAQEALQFLAVSETPVAALVTDLHLRLSRIDGFELIERVRAQRLPGPTSDHRDQRRQRTGNSGPREGFGRGVFQ